MMDDDDDADDCGGGGEGGGAAEQAGSVPGGVAEASPGTDMSLVRAGEGCGCVGDQREALASISCAFIWGG